MSSRSVAVKGAEVRRLYEELGWKQSHLAARAGISVRTLQKIEAGESVSTASLRPVAKALKVPMESLIAGGEQEQATAHGHVDSRVASNWPASVPASPFTRVPTAAMTAVGSLLPALPSCFVGREEVLRELKTLLNVDSDVSRDDSPVRVLTAVRGWPGVGKTTVAAALAYDSEVTRTFGDGVLWASLGPEPDLLAELTKWSHALGVSDLDGRCDAQEVAGRLTHLLHDKRMLLIVDDVWELHHASLFCIGGSSCVTLITTRNKAVAQALSVSPGAEYTLGVLNDEQSLTLLATLVPDVVHDFPDEALALARCVEGLPLALQVAGRMLRAEAGYGWGVADLLDELRADSARILRGEAPPDIRGLAEETLPTVASLLHKSIERLPPDCRTRFTALGAFAPKPATFSVDAVAAVWQVVDPKPALRVLIDRGLLEPLEGMRFHMHALLCTHARSLLTA